MTNTVVAGCDRSPDQEEVVDEVFCGQLEEASHLQTLVFTGEYLLKEQQSRVQAIQIWGVH